MGQRRAVALDGLPDRLDPALARQHGQVIGECTAYYPFAVFLAAVLAYPAGWQSKAVGIACGLPAVVAVNQLRLVSLAYINQWKPSAVDVAHVVVWQSLIIFLTLVLWLLWVVWTDRHARQAS
jgi:exosortase/archaeosortase family protein